MKKSLLTIAKGEWESEWVWVLLNIKCESLLDIFYDSFTLRFFFISSCDLILRTCFNERRDQTEVNNFFYLKSYSLSHSMLYMCAVYGWLVAIKSEWKEKYRKNDDDVWRVSKRNWENFFNRIKFLYVVFSFNCKIIQYFLSKIICTCRYR